MEKSVFSALDKEVYGHYKELQYGYGFRRVLDGESESVTYDTGSAFRLWINQEAVDYALHWHPAAEMIIPLVSTYTVTVGAETFVLQPGDIFIVPACELHQITAPAEGRRLILLFDLDQFDRINNFSYLRSFLTKPVLINRSTCPSIYHEQCEYISQICRDYYGDEHIRDAAIHSRLILFLINYARFCTSRVAQHSHSHASRGKQQELQQCFSNVCSYIQAHLCDDLTLEAVAEVACFSKFHFSRMFKEFTGHSFYEYVRIQKIKMTAALLLNPELSITEIALQTGFSNLTTFNRTFKAVKGCTPTEYRKLFCAP